MTAVPAAGAAASPPPGLPAFSLAGAWSRGGRTIRACTIDRAGTHTAPGGDNDEVREAFASEVAEKATAVGLIVPEWTPVWERLPEEAQIPG